MKVIVTSVFRDKFTHRLYNRGDSFDIKDEARVQDLESRKLAERVEVPEEKKEVKISLFEKEFEKKVEQNEMLEYATYSGNRYGTPGEGYRCSSDWKHGGENSS